MSWYLFFLAIYKHLNNHQKLTQAVQLYWHITTFRSAAGLTERLGKAKNSVSVHKSTEIGETYLPGNCTDDGHSQVNPQRFTTDRAPFVMAVCTAGDGGLFLVRGSNTTKRSVKHVLQITWSHTWHSMHHESHPTVL